MLNQQIKSKIPDLYHSFFPDFVNEDIPKEGIATCNNCTLKLPQKSSFVNTKCCVYYAELPNYLLGGLLSDNRESLGEGKIKAKELIKSKKGISPYGIRKPMWYRSEEKKMNDKPILQFSKEEAETMLCPFYGADSSCTTWAYREHCCSTFFCYSVGGKKGEDFWKGFDSYLIDVELKLASYAAKKLGCKVILDAENIKSDQLNADDSDQNIDLKKYAQIWEGWHGSEEEFYVESYKIVKSLSKEDFDGIMGDTKMSNQLSELLVDFKKNVNSEKLLWNDKTEIRKVSDFIFELSTSKGSMKIKANKLPLLQLFDGERSLIDMTHISLKANASIYNDLPKLLEIEVLREV